LAVTSGARDGGAVVLVAVVACELLWLEEPQPAASAAALSTVSKDAILILIAEEHNPLLHRKVRACL
jgi:hypothetical protein